MENLSSNSNHLFVFSRKNTINPKPGDLIFLSEDNPMFLGIVMNILKISKGFTNDFFDVLVLGLQNTHITLYTLYQIVVNRDHDPVEYIS